ncbi:MAG: MaoC family dehydratase N-terminal domain-containing protein [Clostridia bacterium]|nr:MaoC family dehydratase N-terminal domain-containing protein [Clostridia bacterium]
MTVTEAHFLLFRALNGDNHPIHYDEAYAAGTRFGRRVAHGLLVASFAVLGASTLAPQLHEALIAFVGQESRFLAPVFVGDTVRPSLTVKAVEPRDERRGLLVLAAEVWNQRDEKVMEGEHRYLLRRRTSVRPPRGNL